MRDLLKYKEVGLSKMSRTKRFGIISMGLGLIMIVMSLSLLPIVGIPRLAETMLMTILVTLGLGIGVAVATIILHEGMHGLFFWIYTGKVKFGLVPWGKLGMMAYATAPNKILPKGKMIMVAVAPQIITIVFITLYFTGLFPDLVRYIILGIAALNLGGGILDLYLVCLLMKEKGKVFVEDTMTSVVLYRE